MSSRDASRKRQYRALLRELERDYDEIGQAIEEDLRAGVVEEADEVRAEGGDEGELALQAECVEEALEEGTADMEHLRATDQNGDHLDSDESSGISIGSECCEDSLFDSDEEELEVFDVQDRIDDPEATTPTPSVHSISLTQSSQSPVPLEPRDASAKTPVVLQPTDKGKNSVSYRCVQ